MKDVFKQIYRLIPKRLLAIVAIALTAVLLPMTTAAANTVKLESSLGVANVTAGDTLYKHEVNASYDQVVKFQVFYHNTEAQDSGKIAKNLRVKIAMPTTAAKDQVVRSTVSADNSSNTVQSQATVHLNRSDAKIDYMLGSAVWKHNVGTNAAPKIVEQKISDNVVLNGQGLVLEDEKPCFNFSATVTVLARVHVPGIQVTKQVRVKGSSVWTTSNTAKPGETLEYQISYKNVGNTQQKSVVIRDNMPPDVSYVKSTTMLKNDSGVKTVADGVTTGGIVVGNYNPGAAAYVKFDAKLPTADKLQCGVTEFRNVGVARPQGMNEFYNTAVTKVEKKCANQPSFSCDLLTVNKLGGRKIEAIVKFSASNGATFKTVTYNFGDNSGTLVTDKTTVQHTYAADGDYNVSAKVLFSVDGHDKIVTSDKCAAPVTFKASTPPTPTTLTNTGPGSVAGIFVGTSLVGAFLHRKWTLARR